MTKDLFHASKLKKCAILSEWITSICNTLWWSFRHCNGTVVVLINFLQSWAIGSGKILLGHFYFRRHWPPARNDSQHSASYAEHPHFSVQRKIQGIHAINWFAVRYVSVILCLSCDVDSQHLKISSKFFPFPYLKRYRSMRGTVVLLPYLRV